MNRIPINHTLICNSPYCKTNSQSFVFNDESIVMDLAKEIVWGNPTSILVSGYRGVGKTSFLGKLQDQIDKNSKHEAVFINLNVTKYDKYANLLRQIIRQIYLNLEQTEKINSVENKDEIKLLYARTYSDIQQNSKHTIGSDISVTSSIDINSKLLFGSFGAMFTTGILSYYPPLKDWLLTNLTFIPFGLSALWMLFELIKIKANISKKISSSKDIQTKTLYDDEIAEYLLLNILKSIRQDKVNLIFFIDELDKLSDDSINNLICDLKPIMLSGQATFVLVSGQNLYYKYDTSHTFDDEIVASVFSKIVHISLFSLNDFIKLFNKLSNKDIQNNDIFTKYVYSKILQSNRLPRRFLNLLRQDLTWDDESAFIQVNDDDLPSINIDYRLLNIINEIEVEITFKAGIKDFFITQLHIWVQRMKYKGLAQFQRNEIFGEYKQDYAIWYIYELERLLTLLLGAMEREKLLDKINLIVDEDNGMTEVYYKWNKEISINVDWFEELVHQQGSIESIFLQEFKSLEQLLKVITQDLSDEINPKNVTYTYIIKIFKKANFFTTELSTLKSLIDTKDKLVNGSSLEDKSVLKNIRTTKGSLAQNYIFFMTNQYFKSIEPSYQVLAEYQMTTRHIDIYAQSNKLMANFIFEVKAFQRFNPLTMRRALDNLEALLNDPSSINKKHYAVLVTFFSSNKDIDTYITYLDRLTENNTLNNSILFCNIQQKGDFQKFLNTLPSLIIDND